MKIQHKMTYFVRPRGRYYQAIVKYKEGDTWKQKSFPTKIEVTKRNQKLAEEMARDYRDKFEKWYEAEFKFLSEDILFVALMEEWYQYKTERVRSNTLRFYRDILDYHLIPYFKPKHLKVGDVTPRHINQYILEKSKKIRSSSVRKHYHVLHAILDYAVTLDIAVRNVADKIEPPPKQKPQKALPYTETEIQQLLSVCKGSQIESAVILTIYYGFRREEVLGLRYSAIDFERDTITINHTVVLVGTKAVYQDLTKTRTSNRLLPLMPEIKKYLLELKEKQKKEKELCGNCYYDSDYVVRNADGTLPNPTYISHTFQTLLQKNGMRHITFHDLRHSAATNLIRQGISPKYVQEWLGHSIIGTTLDLYCQLNYDDKKEVGECISKMYSGDTRK